MTCRVARVFQIRLSMSPVFCSECDPSSLKVCHTSNALASHLCPTCASSTVEYGTRKESPTQSAIREQSVA